jgi:hypothetical protein
LEVTIKSDRDKHATDEINKVRITLKVQKARDVKCKKTIRPYSLSHVLTLAVTLCTTTQKEKIKKSLNYIGKSKKAHFLKNPYYFQFVSNSSGVKNPKGNADP